MQILNSLDGLTGKGVGAKVVTASPEKAEQLAGMLNMVGGISAWYAPASSIVTVNPLSEQGVTQMIFAEKTADYALYLQYAEDNGMTIIDLGGNSL